VEPFADILRAMHVTGGVFLDAEFTAPWCISAKVGPNDCAQYVPLPASIVAFHFVSSGRLFVELDGQEPLAAGQGDVIVLPRNDAHRLGSDPGLVAVNADDLIQPTEGGGLAHIRHGGGGEMTRVVCGFLGTARRNDPVLLMLPRIVKLNIADAASAAWIESSFRFAAKEMAAGPVRSPEMLARLAELLFAEAVRRYLSELPAGEGGWSTGVRDPKIAQALGLIHAQLRRHWTAEELARDVAMSRSSFTERFTRIMGETPIRYLAKQRLLAATQKLRDSTDPVARIAFEVGYESESSFNRAFRRVYGMPPAAWRKAKA
jgi:AraC-like DNA-binding protein